MKPKVAIILPVYNCIKYLTHMIKTLYESTNFPFKLIVIDGFSNDGTYEFFERFKESMPKIIHDIELYQIPKKGLVNAINFGIKKAGKLDVYLTQSDVIHYKMFETDWLEEMYNASKFKNTGIVTGWGGWGISGPTFIDGFKWVGTWNAYMTRKMIDKIGLFDEQFSGGDDIDFTYRVIKGGFDITICDYWVHHHQLTNRNNTHSGKHIIEMGKLFKKKWGLK